MPDRERKGVPKHRSIVLKGSLPQGPPAILGTQKIEYPRLSERARRIAEMK